MDGMGWIMIIVVGGIAGLIASKTTKTSHGLTANVILGIVGVIGFNALLANGFAVHFGGIFGQFLTAIAGACGIILIFSLSAPIAINIQQKAKPC